MKKAALFTKLPPVSSMKLEKYLCFYQVPASHESNGDIKPCYTVPRYAENQAPGLRCKTAHNGIEPFHSGSKPLALPLR